MKISHKRLLLGLLLAPVLAGIPGLGFLVIWEKEPRVHLIDAIAMLMYGAGIAFVCLILFAFPTIYCLRRMNALRMKYFIITAGIVGFLVAFGLLVVFSQNQIVVPYLLLLSIVSGLIPALVVSSVFWLIAFHRSGEYLIQEAA